MEFNVTIQCNFEELVKEVFNDFFSEEETSDEVRYAMDTIIENGPDAVISQDDYGEFMSKEYTNVLKVALAIALGCIKDKGNVTENSREIMDVYFHKMILEGVPDGYESENPFDKNMRDSLIDAIVELYDFKDE